MESPDSERSDEVTPEELTIESLEKRLAQAEKMLNNITITGDGISGNVRDGFQYNP